MRYFSFSKRLIAVSCVVACLLWAAPAFAVSLSFQVPQATIHIGDEKEIDVMIDSQGTPINALGGTVAFPSDLLSLEKVDIGDSPIDAWIEKPTLDSDGKLSWSGIIAGGWNGTRGAFYDGTHPGVLFKLFFKAKAAGTPALSFEDLVAKANDGKGTDVYISGNQAMFPLTDGNTLGYPSFTEPLPPSSQNEASSTEYSTSEESQSQSIMVPVLIAALAAAGLILFYAKKKRAPRDSR